MLSNSIVQQAYTARRKDLEYCCGVTEYSLSNFYRYYNSDVQLHKIYFLTTFIQIWRSEIRANERGSTIIFTSSSGENSDAQRDLATNLASQNIDLGRSPITGYDLTLHIVTPESMEKYANSLKDSK